MSPEVDLLRSYSSVNTAGTGCRNEPELLDDREGGMLVLSRKPSQQVMIGSDIRITVVRIDRNQVRLGIQAPAGLSILRSELAGVPPASARNGRPTAPIPIRHRRGSLPADGIDR
jgi:carbon storage regulator